MNRLVQAEHVLDALDVLGRNGRVEGVDRQRPAGRQVHHGKPDDRHADQKGYGLQQPFDDVLQHSLRPLRAQIHPAARTPSQCK
jgi:hypothetical protein